MINRHYDNSWNLNENAAEALYRIIDQKGAPEEVEAYNKVVKELDEILKLDDLTLYECTAKWQRQIITKLSAQTFASPSWTKQIFRKLTPSEVAIYLEVNSFTSYSKALMNKTMDAILAGILSSSRASYGLKFSIAYTNLGFRSAAAWICTVDNGKQIPVVIDFMAMAENETHQSIVKTQRTQLIQRIVSDGILGSQKEEDPSGRKVIDNMDSSFVTKETLEAMLHMMTFTELRKPILEALIVHARRLYDFDESIPDEWVLKVLQ